MSLTYIDSGVLIGATRGDLPTSRAMLDLLDDRTRTFASSVFVRLETIPKATFFRHRETERVFYNDFFANVSKWATIDLRLMQLAFRRSV